MRDGIAIQDRVFVSMSETPKPPQPTSPPTVPAPTPAPTTPPQPTHLPANPPPLEVPDTGERPRREEPKRPLRREP